MLELALVVRRLHHPLEVMAEELRLRRLRPLLRLRRAPAKQSRRRHRRRCRLHRRLPCRIPAEENAAAAGDRLNGLFPFRRTEKELSYCARI
jgi:hypothetical protein